MYPNSQAQKDLLKYADGTNDAPDPVQERLRLRKLCGGGEATLEAAALLNRAVEEFEAQLRCLERSNSVDAMDASGVRMGLLHAVMEQEQHTELLQ